MSPFGRGNRGSGGGGFSSREAVGSVADFLLLQRAVALIGRRVVGLFGAYLNTRSSIVTKILDSLKIMAETRSKFLNGSSSQTSDWEMSKVTTMRKFRTDAKSQILGPRRSRKSRKFRNPKFQRPMSLSFNREQGTWIIFFVSV